MKLTKQTALICIDVQKGFEDSSWGKRNNLLAEQNIGKLLNCWRKAQLPIIHIQHISQSTTGKFQQNSIGSEFQAIAKPIDNEPIFQKHVNSAFIGTNLEQYLREKQYETLIIVGLTTDHCVSTTTRMAANLGFTVYIVEDATATFDRVSYDGTRYTADEVHQIHLTSLHGEFAEVVTTKDMITTVKSTLC